MSIFTWTKHSLYGLVHTVKIITQDPVQVWVEAQRHFQDGLYLLGLHIREQLNMGWTNAKVRQKHKPSVYRSQGFIHMILSTPSSYSVASDQWSSGYRNIVTLLFVLTTQSHKETLEQTTLVQWIYMMNASNASWSGHNPEQFRLPQMGQAIRSEL